MLKALLKKQLLELNQSFFQNKKTGKARSRLSSILFIAAFALLMVGVLGGMFFFVAFSLRPLFQVGLGWLYFTLMGLISVFLGIFGSVFNTYASLYNAKDNDLLLSLPIPVSHILITRLLGVYLMGLLYGGVVLIPTLIVYYISTPVGAMEVIGSLFFALMLSVLVLTLSCILGWVVAKISGKLKNKSLITVIVSLVFLGGYYAIYFRASQLLQTILQNGEIMAAKIKGAAYPLYLFGRAGEGDPQALLIVEGVILLLFFGTVWVLAKSFLRLATSGGKGGKARYRERAVKVKSPDGALLSRELRHFLSSATYMLNCALGTVMLLVMAVLAVVKGAWLRETLSALGSEVEGVLPVLLCGAVCLLTTMNDITAPSVSLEGKNLWLAQSLPVTGWQVLRAKLRLHLLMTLIPALICGVCAVISLGLSPVAGVLVVVTPLLFAVLSAAWGLVINLRMPNLNWTSETVAVKQSVGVLLSILLGWAYTAVVGGLYLLFYRLVPPTVYLLLWALLTAALALILLHWLKTAGVRRFAEL